MARIEFKETIPFYDPEFLSIDTIVCGEANVTDADGTDDQRVADLAKMTVKNAVLETVRLAGPNACPPFVVGVGIGGDFEKCAIMAKRALTRSADRCTGKLEAELLEMINDSGIGPAGLGGSVTALAVNVEAFPTHIAGLPVAVCMCCHVNRHKYREI